MTNQQKNRANARNAKNSTGPRSQAGKARSSRNALRHGLNARPTVDLVTRYLDLILEQRSPDLNKLTANSTFQAAYALAEAEARLDRVRTFEERFLRDYRSGADLASYLTRIENSVTITRRSIDGCSGEVEELLLQRHGLVQYEEEHTECVKVLSVGEYMRVLGRYRSEAESRRRTALRRYIRELEEVL
jgi:hypothetical protein